MDSCSEEADPKKSRRHLMDVGYEGLKFTSPVFGTNPRGGAGGQFDKPPVLSTKVALAQGVCLDAHLAIVGSKQVYGVSRMTFFPVTTVLGGERC